MNTLIAFMIAYQLYCPIDGENCKWLVTWGKPDMTVFQMWQAESNMHLGWRKCVEQYSTWGPEFKPVYITSVANSMFVTACPDEPNDFKSQTYKPLKKQDMKFIGGKTGAPSAPNVKQ